MYRTGTPQGPRRALAGDYTGLSSSCFGEMYMPCCVLCACLSVRWCSACSVAHIDTASRIAMVCAGTMAEGWACYATDLVAEAGGLTKTELLTHRRCVCVNPSLLSSVIEAIP